MPLDDCSAHPHRRRNPLTGQWVLVSPHRTQRPWLGQVEPEEKLERRPQHDPGCYLCPGNPRVNGAINPRYEQTYVFDNDFPALLPPTDQPAPADGARGLLVAEPEPGICRVLCFSPRHDLSLPDMAATAVRTVVEAWREQWLELAAVPHIGYVQIFENRGAAMGASNPHPHGQIWATGSLPNEPALEQAGQAEYLRQTGRCLLCECACLEASRRERLVCENEHFLAVVPFWAVWPFETMLLGRRHATALDGLAGEELDALAELLGRLTRAYDALFGVPFPYSMGFHQRPTDGAAHPEWHLHAHFYPPLLRSATVRKFMVGYEMLGSPQRDLTAESAAARLREVSR